MFVLLGGEVGADHGVPPRTGCVELVLSGGKPVEEATVSLKATESRRSAAKRGIMDKGGAW